MNKEIGIQDTGLRYRNRKILIETDDFIDVDNFRIELDDFFTNKELDQKEREREERERKRNDRAKTISERGSDGIAQTYLHEGNESVHSDSDGGREVSPDGMDDQELEGTESLVSDNNLGPQKGIGATERD